jgi:thiamine kinase-like enzyme
MDPNTKITGTSLLLKDILELLDHKHPYYRRLTNLGKSVTSFDVTNVSTGYGHGSIVWKLNLNFSSHNGLPPETLPMALKVPGAQICLQQESQISANLPSDLEERISNEISVIHKSECFFYREVSPFLNIKMPKVYGTKEWNVGKKEQGYILMDDLSENGICLSKYDSVSPGQIKAVVKEIAHLHAECLKASQNKKWNPIPGRNQEVWARMTDEFISLVPAFIDLVIDKEKVAKDLNKVIDIAGNKNYHLWASREAYKELNLPTVLVHGDLWNSNVFFQKDSNREATSEVLAFIDWQLVCEGSIAADIARYLMLDADGVVRREIEPIIFAFYIQCIRSEIPHISFNESQMRKCYVYCFITQVLSLLIITVFNSRSLQQSINNNEDVALNSAKKDKIILQAIHAIEDAAGFVDDELADVVERFRNETKK